MSTVFRTLTVIYCGLEIYVGYSGSRVTAGACITDFRDIFGPVY